MKLIYSAFFISLIFCSCADDSVSPEVSTGIYGVWVSDTSAEENYVMKKSSAFQGDTYGFRFDPDGRFVEHKINGWCGTPPVTYANYDGFWFPESRDMIIYRVGYWGGTETKKIQIISVTSTRLEYKYIDVQP